VKNLHTFPDASPCQNRHSMVVRFHLASVQIWKWEAVIQHFPVIEYSYLPSSWQTLCSNKQESQIG
jgi:hypothetical protein